MIKFQILRFVQVAFSAYSWLLIARILMSFLPVDPYHPVSQFIARVTDPFLRLFRGLLPPVGMIDLSPMLAFLALRLIQTLVMRMLWWLL